MISSELCYAASFALLETLRAPTGAFKVVSRRLRHVEDVAPESMPALYQLQLNRAAEQVVFAGIAGWCLRAHWYIYVSAPNMEAPTTPILNPRVDDVLLLLPQSPGTGLAFNVDGGQVILAMDGPAEFFEGLLDTKSVARVPIKLIVPN